MAEPTVTIKTVPGLCTVLVPEPRHKTFVRRAREIGGRYSPAGRLWAFDPAEEPRVRQICTAIWGAAALSGGGSSSG
jgi:hypothetical protein